jgi:predicted RND superfamily exporter protein
MYRLYRKLVVDYPKYLLTAVVLFLLVFGYYATKLEIDASAETLLLEDDPDLAFTREINAHFNTENMLVVAYTPHDSLLSDTTLDTISKMSQEIARLPLVDSVDSILTVPLLFSPPRALKDLVDEVHTLQNSHPDRSLVKQEFLTNPLYKGRLVSKDFKTTAILINLQKDTLYTELLRKRHSLRKKRKSEGLSAEEEKELQQVTKAFKRHRDKMRLLEEENVAQTRAVLERYQSTGSLFLGGVNMIASDIVQYVKSDLVVYGTTLIVLLMLILWWVFRERRWVFIPVVISAMSVLAITSALGFFGWEITVISSNFIALQLIITLSIILHLIVRYRELVRIEPHWSHSEIIMETVKSKWSPTFFAILTTIAGFSSLVFSNIKPVINLGWMMSAGIFLSLLITFLVFPAILMLLPKSTVRKRDTKNLRTTFSFVTWAKEKVLRDRKGIFLMTLLSILFTLTGASHLIVENSFINYFKKETEIYRGMKVIDEKLGGTTPLDIVLTFKEPSETGTDSSETSADDDFEDEFEETENEAQYWFTKEKMDQLGKVHRYLEGIEELGSVQSLATILRIGKMLNDGRELDGLTLALLYNKLPEKYRKMILSPYVNVEHNQVRIATRVIDSNPQLRRDALLKRITHDLNTTLVDPKMADFRLSNLMVLYNNMLQSLFSSQIKTLGFTLAILFVMFLLLFRSIKITLIALGVNVISVSLVFGFMGWFHIPLDIMTITIAAIAIGIGVDDTIHYIHRFEEEYRKDREYLAAMSRTHDSVGYAMLYTTLTIMIGFSILLLSNLIPTIYFGLLTVVVMAVALLANILLLPKLLVLFKPFDDVLSPSRVKSR